MSSNPSESSAATQTRGPAATTRPPPEGQVKFVRDSRDGQQASNNKKRSRRDGPRSPQRDESSQHAPVRRTNRARRHGCAPRPRPPPCAAPPHPSPCGGSVAGGALWGEHCGGSVVGGALWGVRGVPRSVHRVVRRRLARQGDYGTTDGGGVAAIAIAWTPHHFF